MDVGSEPIRAKLLQRVVKHVKIARLANTIMRLENRLVEIVQLGKFQQEVHLIVNQIVAMQKLIIQHTKKIVIR